jgi:hypothetical protein
MSVSSQASAECAVKLNKVALAHRIDKNAFVKTEPMPLFATTLPYSSSKKPILSHTHQFIFIPLEQKLPNTHCCLPHYSLISNRKK